MIYALRNGKIYGEMYDNNDGVSKVHNSAIMIITVTCMVAIVESLLHGWEFWVPPLIAGGLIASWWFHLTQYSRQGEFLPDAVNDGCFFSWRSRDQLF